MVQITAAINITADGFCDHTQVVADEEHHEFFSHLLATSGGVLLGRTTYQLFEDYWPHAMQDDTLPEHVRQFARLINDAPKYVASRRMKHTNWTNSHIIDNVCRERVDELCEGTDGSLIVLGSPGLMASLTRMGLIDQYYLSYQPMIAGSGKRLFDEMTLPGSMPLRLEDVVRFRSGVITLHYRVKR